MNKKGKRSQARELASNLFDYKLTDLLRLGEKNRNELSGNYKGLNQAEFNEIYNQVIEAKTSQQSQMSWQAIPRDLAIIVLCIIGSFTHNLTGIISGVVFQLFLEVIFHIVYSPKLSGFLSFSVWFIYPAILLFGYRMFAEGKPFVQILLILFAIWAGTLLISMIVQVFGSIFQGKKRK